MYKRNTTNNHNLGKTMHNNLLKGFVVSGLATICLFFAMPAVALVCGDSEPSAGEQCDDGNTVNGDGCSSDCLSVEAGFSCTDAIAGDLTVTPVKPSVPSFCTEIPDSDGDGVLDLDDNCIDDPNADQSDRDSDGVGDVCDNCPDVFNPGQEDSNGDGIGDSCSVVVPDSLIKEVISGPDLDGNNDPDPVVEVGQSISTGYDFKVIYTNLDGPAVLIEDTVPAEWNAELMDDDGGNATAASANKRGKGKGATKIDWEPDPAGGMITVWAETRAKRRNGKFSPTACGALFLNKGAQAYEIDPATGEPKVDEFGERLPPILESNQLCLAAVADLNGGGLVPDGSGDEDGDTLTDLAEACEIGTDPCLDDTDGDGVLDGADACPLQGAPDASIGEVQDADGCNRQSQCSDGIDNDNDGPIDFNGGDLSCDDIVDDSEDTDDTPPTCPCDYQAAVDVYEANGGDLTTWNSCAQASNDRLSTADRTDITFPNKIGIELLVEDNVSGIGQPPIGKCLGEVVLNGGIETLYLQDEPLTTAQQISACRTDVEAICTAE